MLIEREMMLANEITPLEFMLKILKDEEQPFAMRMDAAKAAAPYVHPKLANMVLQGDKNAPLTVEVVRFANPAT